MSKIEPTTFDIAVVNVVSQLLQYRLQLQPRLGNFESKAEVLTAAGLSKEKWFEYVNHNRHVAVRPHLQSEIVAKLHRHFRVDPNYIYHYPAVKEMFLENIFSVPVKDELPMKSAKELLSIAQMQRGQIHQLKEKVVELQEQVDSWRSIAKSQEKQLSYMNIAADSAATGKENPVKKPVKPATYKPRKRGK